MKKFVFLTTAFALSATQAFAAKTTVEFELNLYKYVKNKEVKVAIPALNKKLKKAGLDGLPEVVVVSENAKAYWNILMKRLEAAQVTSEEQIHSYIDNTYYYEYPELCYRGKMSEVVKVLDGMNGNFLTNEQGIHAYRYGKKKDIRSDIFKTEKSIREVYDEQRPEDVEEYLAYDEKSDAVLVVSDLGAQGDGTELYLTYIKPCK